MSAGTATSPATIRLEQLSVFAHHGIVAEERTLGQRFEFDIDLRLPDCAACRTDQADDAVEYQAIAAVVVEVATNFRFQLLEALAEAVCLELLAEFPADSVKIRACKPSPPLPYAVGAVCVEIERTRDHLRVV